MGTSREREGTPASCVQPIRARRGWVSLVPSGGAGEPGLADALARMHLSHKMGGRAAWGGAVYGLYGQSRVGTGPNYLK